MGKRSRPKQKTTWKQRVEQALSKLGPNPSLKEVTRAVGRQRIPNRSRTWEATVRRVLQELRDEGKLGFQGKPKGKAKRKRGQYHRPTIDTGKAADKLRSILESSFEVGGQSLGITTPSTFANYHEHTYQFELEAQDTNIGDIAETIAQATNALHEWYFGYTAVKILVQVVDTDTDEVLEYRWYTLAWSANPYVAAQQSKYKLRTYGINENGKYRLTENIAAIGWRTRE